MCRCPRCRLLHVPGDQARCDNAMKLGQVLAGALICTRETHAAIKADDARWATETEPPIGHQVRPVVADEDSFLEYANCKACHSTLARAVNVQLQPQV